MEYLTPEEVWYLDAGVVCHGPGDDSLRYAVCGALAKVPSDIVEDVMRNCLFLCESPKNGSYFPADWLAGQSIILVSHDLLGSAEIEGTILHEVAHHVCGHSMDFAQIADGEAYEGAYGQQEKEAWNLVNKWLREHAAATAGRP